jgi:hypothetical protein
LKRAASPAAVPPNKRFQPERARKDEPAELGNKRTKKSNPQVNEDPEVNEARRLSLNELDRQV